jgi:P-type E1-E2 ATPase
MRACATCGVPLDPLRAPVVAILDGRFTYFCSAECKAAAHATSIVPPSVQPRGATPPPIAPIAPIAPKPPLAATAVALAPAPRTEEPAPERAAPVPLVAPLLEEPPASLLTPPPATMRAADRSPQPPPVALITPTAPIAPAPALRAPTPPPAWPTRPIEPPRIDYARASAPLDRDELDDASAADRLDPQDPRDPRDPSPLSTLPPPPTAGLLAGETPARVARGVALALAIAAVAVGIAGAASERTARIELSLASASAAVLLALFASAQIRARRSASLERAFRAELGAPLASASTAALVAVLAAWATRFTERAAATQAVPTAIWVVLAAATAESIAHAATRATLTEAHRMLSSLEPETGGGGAGARSRRPRVGDVLDLATGDRVHEDLHVTSGRLVAELWGDSRLRVRREAGEPLPAGAVIVDGEARARVTAVGRDRAFARLVHEAVEQAARGAPHLGILHTIVPYAAFLVTLVAVALGAFSRSKLGPMTVAAFAAGTSILIPPSRRLAIRDQLWAIVESCRRGAAFRDADAFARASAVRTAIFCVRGTVVTAGPDACDVEVAGEARRATASDVLALAAGAELAVGHPIASAIVRAAQARNVRPVDLRNVTHEPGLGIRAELASGVDVVVGGRALCLAAHVPTAEHEARMAELERNGRDVVIVARDGRVIGLIALHSPLCAGIVAAVQRLHDLEIDPVLLGGGSRGRLEAIGRAIDVEHVRPEVLPRERGAEVKRIAQSGGPAVVIGHPANDAQSLAAADVAVALGEAGAMPEPYAIALVHDHLPTAVDVLALAQTARARVTATMAVGLAPVLLASLPVAFGLTRPTYAPLAALAATIALAVRDLVAAALPEGGRAEEP